MKKFFLSLMLGTAILTTTATPARAVVGLSFSSASAIAAGALFTSIGAAGAGTIATISYRGACRGALRLTGCIAGSLASAFFVAYGILFLEGEEEAEIAFSSMDAEAAAKTPFSADEIATYNRQLPRLNAIMQTISAEVAADKDVDAEARWRELSPRLSAATLAVAAYNSERLLNSLK